MRPLSLQKAYAGDKVKPELLPVPVSLTRSGYPRIIPSFHRRWILRKDDRADIFVQLYLSFFSLSKILVLAKRVRKSTLTSIISPVDDIEAVTEVVSDMKGGSNVAVCTAIFRCTKGCLLIRLGRLSLRIV